jgi:hypothetical protein
MTWTWSRSWPTECTSASTPAWSPSASASTGLSTRSPWEEGSTENATLVTDLITGLRERGLDVTKPILAVIDGSKALARAIKDVFDKPLIHRCQQHRSCKESTCRRVAAGWRRCEEIGCCAVAGRRVAWNVAFLLEERASLPDDVADRGSADVAEGAGEDVQGAQSALVEDGEQDTFAVTDLLGEDATPGSGLAWAAAPLVAEAFGLGGLPGC